MVEKLLTVPEASQILNLSVSKVYKLVSDCSITHIKLGSSVRFKISDLETFMEEHTIRKKTTQGNEKCEETKKSAVGDVASVAAQREY